MAIPLISPTWMRQPIDSDPYREGILNAQAQQQNLNLMTIRKREEQQMAREQEERPLRMMALENQIKAAQTAEQMHRMQFNLDSIRLDTARRAERLNSLADNARPEVYERLSAIMMPEVSNEERRTLLTSLLSQHPYLSDDPMVQTVGKWVMSGVDFENDLKLKEREIEARRTLVPATLPDGSTVLVNPRGTVVQSPKETEPKLTPHTLPSGKQVFLTPGGAVVDVDKGKLTTSERMNAIDFINANKNSKDETVKAEVARLRKILEEDSSQTPGLSNPVDTRNWKIQVR